MEDSIMRGGETFEFEIPYIDAVHFDQYPGVMAREALIVGHTPPALNAPFVYCDMGCGTGATLLTLAASFPDSQFYGVDLSAEHIAHAEAARAEAGIANVSFFCGSFERAARDGVPPCDFVSAHGILSWIPEAVEAELFDAVQSLLKPGGLFQVSVNLQAGWSQMTPLRALMRHLVTHTDGNAEQRLLTAIRTTTEFVASQDNSFGTKNPEAKGITGNWKKREAAYVGHEMLGGAWRQFSMGEAIRAGESKGLVCCGPLTSTARRYRERLAPLNLGTEDPAVLEDFISVSSGESFRSLIFVKPPEPGFQRGDMQLTANDIFGFPTFARWSEAAPPPDDELSDWSRQFDTHPHSLERVMQGAMEGLAPSHDINAVAQIVGAALMMRNAILYAQPARDTDAEINGSTPITACHPLLLKTLAKPRTFRFGGHAPSPVLGGGVPLNPAQAALLRAQLEGAKDRIAFAQNLIAELDPQAPPWALDDPERALPDPAEECEDFDANWLPFLVRLGVIKARSA